MTRLIRILSVFVYLVVLFLLPFQVNASSILFEDNFVGDILNNNYEVNNNNGNVLVNFDRLELSAPAGQSSPYVVLNYILPDDNYSVEVKFKFSSVGNHGLGIIFGDKKISNGQAPAFSDLIYYNWGDVASGHEYRYLDYQGNYEYHSLSSGLNDWHVAKYERASGTNYYFLDGSLLDSTQTSRRTEFISFGNPRFMPGIDNSWTTLFVDYVRVSNLQELNQSFSPYYSQKDELWGNEQYDNASYWAGEDKKTISRWGCALTSVSMLLSKYGIKSPSGEVSTPLVLNNWLKGQTDGYVGSGLVNWLAITRYSKLAEMAEQAPHSLEYTREPYNVASISGRLASSKYPIFGLNGHFVLAHALDGSDWVVADPNKSASERVATESAISKVNVFSPSHTDLSYMMFVGQPGTIFTLDGLDLDVEQLSNDIEEQSTSSAVALLPRPQTGSYTLRVSGTGSFTSYLYDMDGNVTQNTWEIPISGAQEYLITYDPRVGMPKSMMVADHEAPDVSLASPSASVINKSVSIVGSVTDDHPHHYWLVVTNESGQTVAGPGVVNDTNSFTNKQFFVWDTTKVADGQYTIKLEARDSYNNKDNGSIVWKNVRVDNTAPSAPEIALPAEGSSHRNSSIRNEWSIPSDLSGINHYRIEYMYDDGHTFSGYPYRETTTNWRNHVPNTNEQGGVKYRVQAYDNLGNEGAWSTWRHYYYDATAPSLPGVPTTTPNPTSSLVQNWVLGSSSDSASLVSGYYTRTYNVVSASYLNDWLWLGNVLGTTTSLSEGIWRQEVKAQDNALNVSSVVSSSNLTVDITAPSIPSNLHFDNPSKTCGGYTNQKMITVDWDDSTDNYGVKEYDYAINYPMVGGGRGDWSTKFTTSSYRGSLNEGLHILKLRSVDQALNKSAWSNTCEITYDSILPSLYSQTAFDKEWYNQAQVSYFDYSDANLVSSYLAPSCEINAEGTGKSCSVTPSVCDKAGNCNTSVVTSNSINLDLTKPAVAINLWGGRLGGLASDNLSGIKSVEVKYRKDNGSETNVTANGTGDWYYDFPTPNVGSYTVSVVSYDNAGNISDAATMSFTINPSDPPRSEGSVRGESTEHPEEKIDKKSPSPKPKLAKRNTQDDDSRVLGESTTLASPVPSPTPTPKPVINDESNSSKGYLPNWRWGAIAFVFPLLWFIFKKKRK